MSRCRIFTWPLFRVARELRFPFRIQLRLFLTNAIRRRTIHADVGCDGSRESAREASRSRSRDMGTRCQGKQRRRTRSGRAIFPGLSDPAERSRGSTGATVGSCRRRAGRREIASARTWIREPRGRTSTGESLPLPPAPPPTPPFRGPSEIPSAADERPALLSSPLTLVHARFLLLLRPFLRSGSIT